MYAILLYIFFYFISQSCFIEQWESILLINYFYFQVGFKGYGLSPEKVDTVGMFEYGGKDYKLRHGSVVIAAITSCTNTSNPSVMLGAGNFFYKIFSP